MATAVPFCVPGTFLEAFVEKSVSTKRQLIANPLSFVHMPVGCL
jgi:hypothetical protein